MRRNDGYPVNCWHIAFAAQGLIRRGMSGTVFILGAGCSKQAGAPLMNDFLERAEELRTEPRLAADKESFDLVFRARNALQGVHSKSRLDLENVESLFAAFEMGEIFKRLGTLPRDEVSKLTRAIRRLITRTLELAIAYPVIERSGMTLLEAGSHAVQPPTPYGSFVDLLSQLATKGEVSVVTFNYDLCLDYALNCAGIPPDYCVDEFKPKGFPLMKLHGSMNWSRCSKCDR